MLAIAVAAISWQGLAQLGFGRWLLVTAGILVIALILSAVSWYVTGFHVVGRELRVYEGLIWRRTRAIPLERVQAIEVVRPLLARLVGLAELRIEVIGAAKTEAPLAYLTVEEAVELRERLLTLSRGGEPVESVCPRSPVQPAIHRVDNRHVLIANLLTPPTLFLPFGLAAMLLQIVYAGPDWSLIGMASTLTALFGVVIQPVRRVLADWDFTISVDDAGLQLQHGLLDTRNQTVPPRRVQAVEIVAPLMWRPLGWVRVRLDVAGYGVANANDQNMRGGILLPVADRNTTRAVIAQVLDGVDVDALPLRPVPRRARWVSPLAYRLRALGFTDAVVAARHGWVTVRLTVAKLARTQSVRVIQGPLQRRIRLADVHVDTAGRLHVVGRDRAVDEAYVLAGALADGSRAARLADLRRDPKPLIPVGAPPPAS
jgi:putative membrane protein